MVLTGPWKTAQKIATRVESGNLNWPDVIADEA